MFTTSASRLSFDGFMSVYVALMMKKRKKQVIGAIESGMELKLADLQPSQHFTQPPAHYTEASLVKAMEEQGSTSKYLCTYDHYHYCKTLCGKGK